MLNNMKLSAKILALTFMGIVAFSVALGAVYHINSGHMVEMRQTEVKNQTETAWNVINYFVQQAATGQLTTAEAQRQARETVKGLRYGQNDYFWINDMHPRMVMHPERPALDGSDLSQVQDPNGKRLFMAFVETARSKGEGFVEYAWPKPGHSDPVLKSSYIKIVPEWGWIVGTGLYIGDLQDEIFKVLFSVLVILVIFSVGGLVLSWMFGRRIGAAMGQTVQMLKELEKGRLDHRLNFTRKDEIGEMAAAMDSFADSLQNEVVADLQRIAQGDLTVSVRPRDERDEIRRTMQTVADSLGNLIGEVQAVAEQIASGSNQVAQGSQSLADNATQQASSIEEISSSITEMASQTKLNAENSAQANALATQARSSAERGNQEMNQMVQAMAEVNEAGQNISKIIKVIDEIAFQTNLLALNAAVEAARAGAHGKGFAVVAEEVRNLAARSAKAARETADLIAGSVSKAENGAQLANRTANALTEIVQGVAKVSDLVGEIAAASNEQAQGISQVNLGLEQIDQATQQNTCHAEESAAAAGILNGQASHLRELLGRFRVRGSFASAAAAPASPSRKAPPKQRVLPSSAASPKPAAAASADNWGNPQPSSPARKSANPDPSALIALDDSEFGKY